MSEWIYRVLLRLYPSRFRRTYGEEALQLFRDRMGDERGWLGRSRLWLDLLVDLGAIRILGYQEAAVVGAVASAAQGSGGIPSFASLEVKALETRFLVWGGFLSVIFCGAVLFALQHGGGRLPFARALNVPNGLYSPARLRPKLVFSYEPREAGEGSMVRLHAVVSPRDGGLMPTGTVSFLHGERFFVDGTLVDGAVTIKAKLPKGDRLPLNAIYSGDGNYSSVSSVEKAQ